MKKGEKVISLAYSLKKKLRFYCKKIAIAGSIRRHVENPNDVDIVLIPKDRKKLEEFIKTHLKGKFIQGGEHESTWNIKNIKVEIYYTNEEDWGAELLAYSSEKGSGIGLRLIAKRKGFKLNQYGLFDNTGKRVAGKTEKEIYEALGRHYKKPENR
jgi:DNA polymerase (family 10)